MPNSSVPRVPHDALVLVGDGEKAIFLRNVGYPLRVELVVEHVLDQENPPSREQGSDRPGRKFANTSARRSATSETDWHQLAEDRFAEEIAQALYRLAHANRFKDLIVVAPPKVLGKLRESFHPEVSERIRAEVPKELTSHALPDIQRLLTP